MALNLAVHFNHGRQLAGSTAKGSPQAISIRGNAGKRTHFLLRADQEFTAPRAVTGRPLAHFDSCPSRRSEFEIGIETGYGIDRAIGQHEFTGNSIHRLAGQVAQAVLYLVKDGDEVAPVAIIPG